eukprot:5238174-Pleurochrysis_carterae.AAC.1
MARLKHRRGGRLGGFALRHLGYIEREGGFVPFLNVRPKFVSFVMLRRHLGAGGRRVPYMNVA